MPSFSLSLRYSIPIIILSLGGISGLIAFQREVHIAFTRTEEKIKEQAKFTGGQTAGLLEYQYRQNNTQGATLIINRLAKAPAITLALLVDENNVIIETTRLQFREEKVSEIVEEWVASVVQTVRQTQSRQVILNDNRKNLWAFYPVGLVNSAGEILPSEVGVLLLKYDLNILKQQAFADAIRQSLTYNTILSCLCLFLWFFFSRFVVSPLRQLTDTAAIIGRGQLDTRIHIRSPNEIGVLAVSFNQMVEQLQDSLIALEKNNEILEQRVQERTQELEIAKEKAEAANQAKSAFIANMSHELRSPLNAILGFTQIMTRSQTLSKEHLENISIISRSGEHLLTLINNVLDLSKIEAGRITLNQKNFDLHRLLNDIEDMLYLKAQEKGLQLLVEHTNDIPQYICTDEVKLRQVLINIISNAIKFTSQGGVSLRIAQKSSPSNPTQIIFEVEDTGAGIAAEELDKLFEAFSQTETGKQAQEGTGLGLPISRKFVQLMGGDIHVRSRLNKGTIFTFEIKATIVTEGEVVETQIPQRHVIALEPNQPKYRILVVDDKPLNRQLLIKFLSPLGFELQEAVNGQQAIEIWNDWQPHLIWMDMRMPVMDGYEATKQIKATAKGKATTIIALTASVLEEEKVVVLSAGCDDFMRKPFRETDLLNKMAEYLGVCYVYEESEIKPKQKEETLESIEKKVKVLSEELKKQLKDALLTGNLAGIAHTIAQINQLDNSLAEAIQKYCDGFEYEKILNWLSDYSTF